MTDARHLPAEGAARGLGPLRTIDVFTIGLLADVVGLISLALSFYFDWFDLRFAGASFLALGTTAVALSLLRAEDAMRGVEEWAR